MNVDPDSPVFQEILDLIALSAPDEGVVFIGVCGMAGAGKTTFCNTLTLKHPKQFFRLNCDMFSSSSLAERRHQIQSARKAGDKEQLHIAENPMNWYDWDTIYKAVQNLRQFRKFCFDKAWNHKTGELDARYDITLPASGRVIVLCDCIYLLHHPVRNWFDSVLLVESSDYAIEFRRKLRSRDAVSERKAELSQTAFERPYFKTYAKHASAKLSF